MVTTAYATFGLAVRDGRVVHAAPIARWTIGKSEESVAAHFRRRGATFTPLDVMERTPPPA